MKTPTHSSTRVSLEMGMIAFFVLAALSLLAVYLADPLIYAQSLSLTSSPAVCSRGSKDLDKGAIDLLYFLKRFN